MNKFVLLTVLFLFLALLPGCLGPGETSKQNLEVLLESAPPDSQMVMHFNIKKFLENQEGVNQSEVSLPDWIDKISFLFGNGGMIQTPGGQVMIVQGTGFDLLAGIPPFLGVFQTKEYKQEKFYIVEKGEGKTGKNLAYRIHEGRIFIGKEEDLKKTIKAEKEESLAGKFSDITQKMENDDFLMLAKGDNQTQGTGVFGSLEEETNMTAIVKTENATMAGIMKNEMENNPPEKAEIKSVKTEGQFLIIVLKGNLEDLGELMKPPEDEKKKGLEELGERNFSSLPREK